MKHRIGYNRLGRKSSHRKALIRNMVTQLYRHERIRTTKSKALEVRKKAEKYITRAKEDSVHNRRIVAKDILDKEIVAKLFTDIGPRFADRPGGYTRILKLGFRKGDAADMVILELVEEDSGESAPKARPKKAEAVPEPEGADQEDGTGSEEEAVEEQEADAVEDSVEAEDESETVDDVKAEAEQDEKEGEPEPAEK